MNMKRNKKIIGISCFVLLLLVGIIYGYMHSIEGVAREVLEETGLKVVDTVIRFMRESV